MFIVKSPRKNNASRVLIVVGALIFVIAYLSRYPNMETLQAIARRAELVDTVPSAGQQQIRSRGSSAPGWCSRLAAKPLTWNKHPDCKGTRLDDADNARCGRFFSQYNQDVWVWHALARFMTLPGVYIDVGSNRAASISNTFFLDRCLGWRGICVEGQTRYHAELHKHRTCAVHACASDREEVVPFLQAHNLGGISSVNKNINGTASFQAWAKNAESVMTRCRPLRDILEEEGITEVSYMSVDVEGAELKVLNGIDFEKTHFALINIEGRNKEARRFLEKRGFKVVRTTDDTFFMSKKMIKKIEALKGRNYLSKINLPTK